jgi:Fur family ferric uptake transcriptional regulator
MPKYSTAQRRRLMAFLEEHPDRPFTAREIAEQLQDDGVSISAVYRNLSALEEDGQIAGVFQEGARDKYYRCLLSDECRTCIHLTCIKCGKTFHLGADETQWLLGAAARQGGFRISAGHSVLYGVCGSCG